MRFRVDIAREILTTSELHARLNKLFPHPVPQPRQVTGERRRRLRTPPQPTNPLLPPAHHTPLPKPQRNGAAARRLLSHYHTMTYGSRQTWGVLGKVALFLFFGHD